MVRRGSTVRVRQRALQKRRKSGFRVQVDLLVAERAVGVEHVVEHSARDAALLGGGFDDEASLGWVARC
jgi:hypothetical protein